MWTSFHPRRYLLAALLAAVVGTGCISFSVHHIDTAQVYYDAGPEVAINTIESSYIRYEDQILASLERSVFHQELGQYDESNQELFLAWQALQQSRATSDAIPGLLTNAQAGCYRGEYFEQVFIHTMRTANFLAMQDIESAAKAADAALAVIATLPCAACQFPFTRYLAALSYDYAGRYQEAGEVLLEAVSENPHLLFLQDELDRFFDNPALYEEVGFAPPPVSDQRGRRVLYVILLLGGGPAKIEASLPVPPNQVVAWPRYVPRYPPVITGAELQFEDSTHYSAILTDMLGLAGTSLKARAAGMMTTESDRASTVETSVQLAIESEYGGLVASIAKAIFVTSDHADLRHWSSLPASCQILRVRLPDEINHCRLIYTSPAGETIDQELIQLPDSWQQGPLFVTRRMP